MKTARFACLALVLGGLLVLGMPPAVADDSGPQSSRVNQSGPGVPVTVVATEPGSHTRAIGTIQYDNDVPFQRLANTDDLVGNRFVAPGDPHSIASVSFRLAQNYGSGVQLSVWDVNSGSVVRLREQYLSGIPSTNVTSVVLSAALSSPVVGHSGPFIAGIHNTFYPGYGCPSNTSLNGTCDGIALTEGSPASPPPWHGAYINLAGGAFEPPTTQVASSGQNLSQNAIFRVTGDNLPVELMGFTAE